MEVSCNTSRIFRAVSVLVRGIIPETIGLVQLNVTLLVLLVSVVFTVSPLQIGVNNLAELKINVGFTRILNVSLLIQPFAVKTVG